MSAKSIKHGKYRKYKGKFFHPCEICTSPYRSEMESLLRAKEPMMNIARKYLDKFKGCTKVNSLMAKIRRHKAHLEQARQIAAVRLPDDSPHEGMSRVSMEQFAQRMLKIGNKALNWYEQFPHLVKLQDVIAAQRLLIEKQRLSIHEDALKLAMARFFGGFPVSKDSIEGEIVNDPRLPQPPGAILPGDKE